MDATILHEAIEAAANAGDRAVGSLMNRKSSVSSPEREASIRNSIRRFLESLPEETTVLELLETMGGVE